MFNAHCCSLANQVPHAGVSAAVLDLFRDAKIALAMAAAFQLK